VGYRPQPKRFRVAFEEDHELHGLELVTRSVPIGTILTVLRAAGSGAKTTPEPEDVAAVQGLFEEFGGALIEWNLEHPETGEPVPATPEGVAGLDFDLVSRIAMEWVQAVLGASAPLGAGSNGGRPAAAFPVSSIPMAPRSSSLAS
jgi:hypothetical protein